MDKPHRVLLVGATGFIGLQVQTAAGRAGLRVAALVRHDSPRRTRLLADTRIINAALTDTRAVAQAVADADAVVYAAGAVRGRSAEDFDTANVAGVRAVTQVLDAMPTPPPLLLISSLAATEPTLSEYAKSKAAGEAIVRASTRIAWCVLRPPAVYGPDDVEMRGILNTLRRGIAPRPGGPRQRLSLLHVNDLARAVMAWLELPSRCERQTFAIDDGHIRKDGAPGYDWAEFGCLVRGRPVRTIRIPGVLLNAIAHVNLLAARTFDYAPMLTPGKVRELQHERWLCDNAAFTRLTGWQPSISLAAGARELFAQSAASG